MYDIPKQSVAQIEFPEHLSEEQVKKLVAKIQERLRTVSGVNTKAYVRTFRGL